MVGAIGNSDFDVAVRAEAGYDLVTARGDLDAASSTVLRGVLQDPSVCQQPHVIVDLTGLGFLDSIGISTLVAARRVAGTLDKRLVLVCVDGPVLRVLKLVGLDEVMGVHGSVDEAVQALETQ